MKELFTLRKKIGNMSNYFFKIHWEMQSDNARCRMEAFFSPGYGDDRTALCLHPRLPKETHEQEGKGKVCELVDFSCPTPNSRSTEAVFLIPDPEGRRKKCLF
jgi:hypothetical protein